MSMIPSLRARLSTSSSSSRSLLRPFSAHVARSYATAQPPQHDNLVNLVEVGPRDGLQNEKGVIPVAVKVELIERLVNAGVNNIEAGSFVSPKWVPQMAGTSEVLTNLNHRPGVHYSVLVPNPRGLEHLLNLLSTTVSHTRSLPLTDEVSIFAAATAGFTRANLNLPTVGAALERLEPVARLALDNGLRVRGYVSVVVECPYEGAVEAGDVRDVAGALRDMGCYEVSLGDTVGRARPHQIGEMLEEVKKRVPVQMLAGHFHDTYGTAVSNVLTALQHGVRTIDSSVGGLGGCPYSPGATGNVATEDVLYALQGSGYHVNGTWLPADARDGDGDGDGEKKGTIDLEQVVDVGLWISEQLGRGTASRAGKAIWARREREAAHKKKEEGETKRKL